MDQFYMQFDASNHLDKYLLILRCFDVGGPERVKQELGLMEFKSLDLDWSLQKGKKMSQMGLGKIFCNHGQSTGNIRKCLKHVPSCQF